MPNTLTNTPQSGDILATSQGNLLQNNNYYANTLGKDHQVGPTTSNRSDTASFEGRHIQVCFNNRSGGPPTVAGIGDGTNALLYASNGNIFFGSVTGAGAFQLTTYNSGSNFGVFTNNYTPQAGGGAVGANFSAGWTFLPGGLILQYGIASNVNATGTRTTIKLPITFTSAVYTITIGSITAEGASPSANNQFIDFSAGNTPTTTQFKIVNSSGSAARSIYWNAIGK